MTTTRTTTEYPELANVVYLTGVSTPATRELGRSDLGLLATPASSVVRQRHHYGVWAADNGCFAETDAKPFDAARWLAWLEEAGPEGCLFAVLPDVVGDAAGSVTRSLPYVEAVRELGFPIALVAQNGLEDDPELLELVLTTADALFVGGSPECRPCGYVRPAQAFHVKACPECGAKLTEWKLSEGARYVMAEARRRGLWVHLGRVNSGRRMRFAHEAGADSADGTFLGFGPAKNLPRLLAWLDELHELARPELAELTSNGGIQ